MYLITVSGVRNVSWAAMVSQFRRDVRAVHAQAEAAVALATEQGV